MANIKISDLTAAAAASGTQEFEVNDSLTSKKVTGAQLKSYVLPDGDKGDITTASGGTAWTIDNNAVTTAKIADSNITTAKIADNNVTLAKLPDIATASILGRNTAGTGDPEVLTGAQARTIIGADNASNLTSGTVGTARLGSGTADSTTYLRGDGTWSAVSSVPSNLAVGSICVLYNFNTVSYNQGDTVSSTNVGYASAKPVTANGGDPFSDAMRNVNTTVPGSAGNNNSPTTTAVSGTWRALSYAAARTYDGCAGLTYGKAFLAIRTA